MEIDSLQQMANAALSALGVTNVQVAVAHLGYNTIAAAAGITFNLRPTWNIMSAIGVIHVQPESLQYFSDREWKFVIAHECSHIFHSHIVDTLFWNLLERILAGPEQEYKPIVNFAKALLMLFSIERLPPNAVTLRDNEYIADETALKITNDIGAAKSTLMKVCYIADETALKITNDIGAAKSTLMKVCNNNLDSTSHTFDLAGWTLPAMTLRSRLEEMERRYNAHLGYF